MGGGGPKPTAKTGDKPAPRPTYQSVQPFMPGMDSMLAQQLSQGFGMPESDILKQFASLYSPMQLPTSPVYLNPTPASPTPASPDKKTNSRMLDNRGGRYV